MKSTQPTRKFVFFYFYGEQVLETPALRQSSALEPDLLLPMAVRENAISMIFGAPFGEFHRRRLA